MPALPVKFRRWILPVALIVIFATSAVDHLGLFGYEGDDMRRFDGQSLDVAGVVGGDTLQSYQSHGRGLHVHFLGVSAPAGAEDWANESKQALSDRITGKKVLLRLDPMQTRTRSGDIDAYVYLEDELINVEPIRLGHAYADRRQSHAWGSVFESSEASTRRRKLALWETLRSSQMPQWRRDWLRSFSSSSGR